MRIGLTAIGNRQSAPHATRQNENGPTCVDPFHKSVREALAPRCAKLASERLKLGRGHFAGALVFLEFEAHPLTFVEAGEPCTLDSRDVHEHIGAARLRLDEAVAFLLVEPFYGAGSHVDLVFR